MLIDPANITITHNDVFSITCCVLGLDFVQYEVTWSRQSEASDLNNGMHKLSSNAVNGFVKIYTLL